MSEITVVRHPRARRYVLRLAADGGLRLTVPRRASVAGGLRFVQGQQKWIDRERARMAERAKPWIEGTEIWWRGERVPLALTSCFIVDRKFAVSIHHCPCTLTVFHQICPEKFDCSLVPDL